MLPNRRKSTRKGPGLTLGFPFTAMTSGRQVLPLLFLPSESGCGVGQGLCLQLGLGQKVPLGRILRVGVGSGERQDHGKMGRDQRKQVDIWP